MLKSPQGNLCPAIGQKQDRAGKYPYTTLEKGRSRKDIQLPVMWGA